MKFDLSVMLLLVIACMLAYVTYQSTILVQMSVFSAKVDVANFLEGGKSMKDLDKVTL